MSFPLQGLNLSSVSCGYPGVPLVGSSLPSVTSWYGDSRAWLWWRVYHKQISKCLAGFGIPGIPFLDTTFFYKRIMSFSQGQGHFEKMILDKDLFFLFSTVRWFDTRHIISIKLEKNYEIPEEEISKWLRKLLRNFIFNFWKICKISK